MNRHYKEGLINEVAKMLSQTEFAHGRYETLSGQPDEDWPTWYAQHLHQIGLPMFLGKEDTWDDLAAVLAELHVQHQANAPDQRWQDYYARRLVGLED